MGLILDSSVVIAAERRGDNVTQMLKQIAAATGDQRTALSSIGLTGLVHGIYRAQAPEARSRRESFIHELLEDVEVYPYTKETAMLAGKLDAEQRSLGVVIPFGDLLIGRRFASGVFLGDRQREALPANPRTQGRPAVNSHLDAQSVLGLNPSCYRARYYDPTMGRFIREDPVQFNGGINFYRYTRNSPANFIDPLGLNPAATSTMDWFWIYVFPAAASSPWVRAAGGFFGGFIGGLAMPDATGIDDARAIPKSPATPKCDRNRDDHCNKIYEDDIAKCMAIRDKQQQRVCGKQAMKRYGECLAKGDPVSPLSWWE